MANMSYCRFRNTLEDLRDCADALDELDGNLESLSAEERTAAEALLRLCTRIDSRHALAEREE